MAKQESEPSDLAYHLTDQLINRLIRDNAFDILGLSEREQQVITLRWKYKLSLEQIGQNQSIRKERAREVYNKAITRLYLNISRAITDYPEKKELHTINKLLKEENERYKTSFAALSPEEKEEFKNVEILSQPIDELDLSIRAINGLLKAKVYTVADLLEQTPADLLSTQNFGVKTMQEIELFLHEHRLHFKRREK